MEMNEPLLASTIDNVASEAFSFSFFIFLHQLTAPMCSAEMSSDNYFRGIKIHSRQPISIICESARTAHWRNNELTAPSAARGIDQTCSTYYFATEAENLRQSFVWTLMEMILSVCVDAHESVAPVVYGLYASRALLRWQHSNVLNAFKRKILIVFNAVQYLIFSFDFIWHDKP